MNNSVDRRILSTFVLNNVTAIKTLESIVHPLVSMKRDEFYEEVSVMAILLQYMTYLCYLKQTWKHNLIILLLFQLHLKRSETVFYQDQE